MMQTGWKGFDLNLHIILGLFALKEAPKQIWYISL